MGKILSAIISFILSVNSYTVIYNNDGREKNELVTKNNEVQENLVLDESIPSVRSQGSLPVYTAVGWWTYPAIIKPVSRNGDDLLVLVNKEYQLPSTYAPSDLVNASLSGIRNPGNHLIRNILVTDLAELVTAAKNDEIDLSIRSGYRSYDTQLTTYNYWLRVNGNDPDEADKVSARAGHSQHQLGTAVDFSSSEIGDGIGGVFAGTLASKWLSENAWRYGFILSFPKGYESVTGYNYESWHYRYIGKAYAQEVHTSGIILELYLRSKN